MILKALKALCFELRVPFVSFVNYILYIWNKNVIKKKIRCNMLNHTGIHNFQSDMVDMLIYIYYTDFSVWFETQVATKQYHQNLIKINLYLSVYAQRFNKVLNAHVYKIFFDRYMKPSFGLY